MPGPSGICKDPENSLRYTLILAKIAKAVLDTCVGLRGLGFKAYKDKGLGFRAEGFRVEGSKG